MPIFLYRNPNTGEIKEIVQSVHDKHEFFDENGLKYDREYTIPTASIDTKWNPDDPKDFVRKSAQKKGSLGELIDKSKELSDEREKKYGVDQIKEKKYQEYSNVRGGKRKHMNQKKELLSKALKNNKHFELA